MRDTEGGSPKRPEGIDCNADVKYSPQVATPSFDRIKSSISCQHFLLLSHRLGARVERVGAVDQALRRSLRSGGGNLADLIVRAGCRLLRVGDLHAENALCDQLLD